MRHLLSSGLHSSGRHRTSPFPAIPAPIVPAASEDLQPPVACNTLEDHTNVRASEPAFDFSDGIGRGPGNIMDRNGNILRVVVGR